MRSTIRGITALSLMVIVCSTLQPANAKRHFTITQRQGYLRKEIAADQKTGDLTLKEADNLRGDLDKIVEKENKMKAANGGKLGVEDNNKLEGDLNKISLRIKKKELKKRTEG